MLGLLFAAGVVTPILPGSGPDRQGAIQSNGDLRKGRLGPSQANQQTGVGGGGGLGTQLQTNTPLARLAAFLRRVEQGHAPWADLNLDDQQTMDFLIWSLPAADYPKAFALRRELRPQLLRPEFETSLVRYWREFDPLAALAAAQTAREFNSINLIGDILRGWGDKDPAAALTWLRQSAGESIRGFALAQVLPKLARTDPQGAMAALAEMPSGLQKQ